MTNPPGAGLGGTGASVGVCCSRWARCQARLRARWRERWPRPSFARGLPTDAGQLPRTVALCAVHWSPRLLLQVHKHAGPSECLEQIAASQSPLAIDLDHRGLIVGHLGQRFDPRSAVDGLMPDAPPFDPDG